MLPAAWMYILTNSWHTVLYVGATNDLPTRIWEHQTRQNPNSFTAKYNVTMLIYFEAFETVIEALRRERYIKRKTRRWKAELITRMNPTWEELIIRPSL